MKVSYARGRDWQVQTLDAQLDFTARMEPRRLIHFEMIQLFGHYHVHLERIAYRELALTKSAKMKCWTRQLLGALERCMHSLVQGASSARLHQRHPKAQGRVLQDLFVKKALPILGQHLRGSLLSILVPLKLLHVSQAFMLPL
jgi:hypothetical protein